MKAQTQIRICAYLLALLGIWSVTLTEFFSSIWPLAGTAMVVAAWFYEGSTKHPDAYRRIWMGLGFCLLAFFPFDISLTGNLLVPALHLSMFAQAFLIFNRKDMAAYRRIYLVSFAQVLASTELSKDIVFAVILAVFCMIAIYGIALMQLIHSTRTPLEPAPGRRNARYVPRALLGTSLMLALLLVPFCLAFFFSAPRLRFAMITGGSRIEALTEVKRAKTRTGFTKTVRLGSFGRIQEDQTAALRVEIPATSEAVRKSLKWRGGAMNIYDGTTWSSSRDNFAYYSGREMQMASRNSGMVYARADGLFIMDERYALHENTEQLDADPRLLKQQYYVEIPFSDNIFGADEIKAIQGPFQYGLGQDFNRSFFMYNREALPEFISYTVYSEFHEPNPGKLSKIPYEQIQGILDDNEYGSYVRTHYLQLPASLNPEIRRLTLEITRDADTPYDKVNAIKDFLETEYTYSLNLGEVPAGDPLSHFLFVSRTGHCEYFATAMTLMTRILGVPARLVKGFQKGEWNSAGEFFDVRQRDAHAWVEVFFPGYGWLSFDPSPRIVADEYLEQQRTAIARMFSKNLMLLKIQWRKHIVGYNETRRVRLFAEVKDLLFHDAPTSVISLLGVWARKAWDVMAAYWAVTGCGAILLLAIFLAYKRNLIPTIPWPIKRSKRARSGTLFYERMLRLLEKRKIVKPAYVTPLEFLDSPSLLEHPMFGDIEAITSIYYRIRYGGGKLGDNEAAGINDMLHRLKRSNGQVRERVRGLKPGD